MRLLSLRNALVSCLLLGAPAGAMAQSYDNVEQYDSTIEGQAVGSVDVFYDQLSPHGVWIDDPDLGHVFTPEQNQYEPYTNGHWQYTSVGFVWISSEPFAWATAHYGRWAFSPSFARWVWLPDTTWGPAWVEWRESGDSFGWAPLAPQIAISFGYSAPVSSWRYARADRLLDVNVVRYYEPRQRVIEIHRSARPVDHYAAIGGIRVVVGPSATRLREHRIEPRRTKIEARAVGRWNATEARAATQRAEQRRATNETRNRQRIESNVTLRAKVAAVAPRVKAQPRVTEPPRRIEDKKVTPAPAPRVEPKPQPRVEQPRVQQPRVEPKRPEQPRVEPKRVEPRPQPPAQPKVEPREQPRRVEPREQPVQPKAEPRRPEPRPQAQPRPERAQPAPKPAPAPKSEPKADNPRDKHGK